MPIFSLLPPVGGGFRLSFDCLAPALGWCLNGYSGDRGRWMGLVLKVFSSIGQYSGLKALHPCVLGEFWKWKLKQENPRINRSGGSLFVISALGSPLEAKNPLCARGDLNPYARRHRNLNPACLPISPLALWPKPETSLQAQILTQFGDVPFCPDVVLRKNHCCIFVQHHC